MQNRPNASGVPACGNVHAQTFPLLGACAGWSGARCANTTGLNNDLSPMELSLEAAADGSAADRGMEKHTSFDAKAAWNSVIKKVVGCPPAA